MGMLGRFIGCDCCFVFYAFGDFFFARPKKKQKRAPLNCRGG